MSAFLVVYDLKGKPVELNLLSPMLEMLSHRAPDGLDYIAQDNFFISHHHLWITPEEYGRKQPFKNNSGNLIITFDGRLDNREELYKLTDHDGTYLRTVADAELCLILYEKYGESSFGKLIGPYSFIIADLEKNRITGARDPMSERGFYYYISDKLFIAASEETAILKHPAINCKINEFTLTHFFALEPVYNGSTFFENVNELLAGHYIKVTGKNHSISKFYEFPGKSIRYRDEQEYHQHYRELLELGVKSRMRCVTPVSVMLSGGIDSNSIAALAARYNRFDSRIKAISWTFNNMRECDERAFIDPASEMYGIEKIQFNADDLWPLSNFQTYFKNPNSPLENLYRNLKQRVYSLCSENNSRLIFNGWYADSYYAGYNGWLMDLLKDCRLAEFLLSMKWLLKNTKYYGIIYDPAFRRMFRFIRRFIPKGGYKDSYYWLTDYAKSNLPDRMEIQRRFKDFHYPERAASIFSNQSYYSPASEHFCLNSHSIELECPYTDIRLVNYMMNIPSYELYQNGIKKYIAKKALSGILPLNILERNDNTSLTPLYIKGIRKEKNKRVMEILNSDDGWHRYINKDWLYKTLSNEVSSEKHEVIVWNCICYNMWIKNLKANGLYKT